MLHLKEPTIQTLFELSDVILSDIYLGKIILEEESHLEVFQALMGLVYFAKFYNDKDVVKFSATINLNKVQEFFGMAKKEFDSKG